MKTLFILLLAFCLSGYSFAQKQGSELIDSLKSELTRAVEDTNKVKLLGNLCFENHRFNTDLGIKYGEQAIALAEKLQWEKGIALVFNYLGTNYGIKGNYPKSLQYFMKSLNKFTEIGDNEMVATLSNNLGLTYIYSNDLSKATEYIDKALSINEKLNNRRGQSLNYGNLGIIYSKQSQFVKANEYYYKALEIDEKLNNKDAVARHYGNISINKLQMRQYCDALEPGFKALKISKEINSVYNQANSFRTIGEIYFELSIDSIKIINNCRYDINDKNQNLLNAKRYSVESLSFYKELKDLKSLSEVSLTLSRIYEKLSDNKTALKYYKKYSANKDSLFSKDISDYIEAVNLINLRDNQIRIKTLEIENKSSQLVYQIIISITIVITVSLLSFFLYKKQKYQKAINFELDQKNDELVKLNATKNKFFSIIAHDLKGPFQGFIGMTEVMAEDVTTFSHAELKNLIKEINSSANNLYKLLVNLLDWAQMQKGKITFNPQEKSLTEIVDTNFHSIEQRAAQKGISFINSIPGTIKIYADEKMINAVIRNILSNSVKFTRTNGKVIISAKEIENNMVEISVRDSGIGMSTDLCKKLFKIEEKIGRRGTDGETSTGLGLLLCKEFVEVHGGKIWVESEEGMGSTFYLTFPVKEIY